MRAEQEAAGGVGVGEGAAVDAGGEEVGDEGVVPEVEGERDELAAAADEVGTELEVTAAGVVGVSVPAVVGAGLEHAPIRPATPTRASTVAAVGRGERPVPRRRRLTGRA